MVRRSRQIVQRLLVQRRVFCIPTTEGFENARRRVYSHHVGGAFLEKELEDRLGEVLWKDLYNPWWKQGRKVYQGYVEAHIGIKR